MLRSGRACPACRCLPCDKAGQNSKYMEWRMAPGGWRGSPPRAGGSGFTPVPVCPPQLGTFCSGQRASRPGSLPVACRPREPQPTAGLPCCHTDGMLPSSLPHRAARVPPGIVPLLTASPSARSPTLTAWALPHAWAQNPPAAVAPRGHVPGGAEPAALVSRRAPLRCLPALGDKDGDSLAAPRPPTSPYPVPALRGCSCCPTARRHQGHVHPTNPPAWPGSLSRAPVPSRSPPCVERRAVCIGRHVPSPPATSAHQGRLRLVSHAASRPAQMPSPASPGWGHVCGAAGLPNPFPALAGRQQAALGSLRGPRAPQRGIRSWKGLHPSARHLASTQTLFKRWKIPARSKAHPGTGGLGQGSSVGNASGMCRVGGSVAPDSVARRTRITLGKPGPSAVPVPPVKPRHGTVPTRAHHAGGSTAHTAAAACQPCPCHAAPARGAMTRHVPAAHDAHL